MNPNAPAGLDPGKVSTVNGTMGGAHSDVRRGDAPPATGGVPPVPSDTPWRQAEQERLRGAGALVAGLVLLAAGLLAAGAGLVLLVSNAVHLIRVLSEESVPPHTWRFVHLALAGVALLVGSVPTAQLARQLLAMGGPVDN